MGRFDDYLMCSDLDGTLLNENDVLTPKVIQSINCFQQNGGLFTIATGRSPFYLIDFLKHFSLKIPVISHNGATIYSYKQQKFLLSNFLKPNLTALMEVLVEKSACLNQFTFHGLEESYPFSPNQMDDTFAVYEKDRWCKLVLSVSAEHHAIDLRDMLRQSIFAESYTFVRSWATGLEIIPKGACKGEAVKFLRESLPDIKKVICIGDYENDITMLQYADISYAVANAIQEVLDTADRITTSNNNNAVAEAINTLYKSKNICN